MDAQPFRDGDVVMCVDGDFAESMRGLKSTYVFPKTGTAYTVRAVEPYWENDGTWAVRLVEINNPETWFSGLGKSMEVHFRSRRFRSASAH